MIGKLTTRSTPLAATLVVGMFFTGVAFGNSQTGEMAASLSVNSVTDNGNGTYAISVTARAIGGSAGVWDYVFTYNNSDLRHPPAGVFVTRSTRSLTTTLTVAELCPNAEATTLSVEVIGPDARPAWAQSPPLAMCL